MLSNMYREAREIPQVVETLLCSEFDDLPEKPGHLYTLARGSSDHAATVIHRLMQEAPVIATTLPPSLLRTPVPLPDSIVLAISQSGASPDLHEGASRALDMGASVISVVNNLSSPLAEVASAVLDQQAGPELAVAATKSVVASILCGAKLAMAWGARFDQLEKLPEQLAQIQACQFDALEEKLCLDSPLIVLGRGSGLGIAGEVALKIQELLRRPAFCYSAAEVMHGPAGMIDEGFEVLALAVGPEADEVRDTASKLEQLGARVMLLDQTQRNDMLAATELLAWIYLALESACRARGLSPDKPKNLNKITLTR